MTDVDDDLEVRLAATFAQHASALAVEDRRFHPDRVGSTLPVVTATTRDRTGPDADPDLEPDADGRAEQIRVLAPAPDRSPARAGRLVWVAVAVAATVLVALVVALGAARTPAPSGMADEGVVRGDRPVLMPTWVPDGLQPWAVSVAAKEAPEWLEPRSTELLRSTVGTGAVLLEIGPDVTPVDEVGDEIAVRGTSGLRQDAGSVPMNGRITWSEGGRDVVASLRDVTDAEAVALLDGLVPRDVNDPRAGYDPAAGAPWTIAGEEVATTDAIIDDSLSASFAYASAVPGPDDVADLTIVTSTAGRHVHEVYLTTAFRGSVRADGTAVAVGVGPPAAAGVHHATVAWPDGRSIILYGAAVGDDVVARVEAGTRLAALDEARVLEQQVSDRLGGEPIIASADLPSGRVELVGESEPTAICLSVADHARSCSGWLETQVRPAATALLGSQLLEGTWMLVLASSEPVDFYTPPWTAPAGSGGPPGTLVADHGAEVATDGGWTLSLFVVPSGPTTAGISLDGRSWGYSRPLA